MLTRFADASSCCRWDCGPGVARPVIDDAHRVHDPMPKKRNSGRAATSGRGPTTRVEQDLDRDIENGGEVLEDLAVVETRSHYSSRHFIF